MRLRILLPVAFLLWAGASLAGSDVYWFRSQTLGQLWENYEGDTRMPFSQYVTTHVADSADSYDFWTDFRYFKDIGGDEDRFDLYQGSVKLDPLKGALQVEAGRYALNEGVNFYLLDGLRLGGSPIPGFDWSAFGGYTGSTELGHYRDSGNIFGGRLGLFPRSGLRSRIQTMIEDYDSGAEDRRAGASAGYTFAGEEPILVDGGVEYTFAGEHLSDGFVTGEWMKSERLSFSTTYQYRNPLLDPDPERDPIYASFAADGVHTVRPAVTYRWRDLVTLTPSYELNTYEALDSDRKITHRGEIAGDFLPFHPFLHARLSYSYWRSYGGNSHLVSLSSGYRLTNRWKVSGGGEFVTYEKITNEKANALRGFVESRFDLLKNLSFSATLDALSHEGAESDLRMMFLLEATFGSRA